MTYTEFLMTVFIYYFFGFKFYEKSSQNHKYLCFSLVWITFWLPMLIADLVLRMVIDFFEVLFRGPFR